jgi:hypothetical protein
VAGITDLDTLLASLSPTLQDGCYVFCTFAGATHAAHGDWQPLAAIREPEGLTFVLDREIADRNNLEYEGVFRCITLQVHSSLQAVGLTAAVSSRLAQHRISANMIAGFHHDHVLVPEEDAEKALHLLSALASEPKQPGSC